MVTEFVLDGVIDRAYPTSKLDVTRDVVCDTCNSQWMSALTAQMKAATEGFIRYDSPATLLPIGIMTVASFAFMKAAVLDWSLGHNRRPCIPRSACTTFRDSITSSSGSIVIPNGIQVWIGRYQRERAMEAFALLDEMEGAYRFKDTQS
jgi:hypothetical protein